MVHGDPQQRHGASRGSDGDPEAARPRPRTSDLLLEFAPILFAGHAGPARARPAGARRWPRASCATSASSCGRCRPAHQLYKGLPGIHVVGPQPQRGGGARARRRGGAAARDHDRRDPHPRPALHLRERSRTTCRSQGLRVFSGDPPDLHRAAPVGADRGHRRRRRRRAARRATASSRSSRVDSQGAAAPDRARGLLAAQGRLPRRRRLHGHGARLPRARPAPAQPPRRTPPSSRPARAFLEWLLDDNYIFMGTVSYAVGPDGARAAWPRDRERRLHRPGPPPRRLPRRRRARRGAPAARRRATTGSSTSTSARTPRPSTTSSRSRTSTVREWGEDGKLGGAHPAARPLRPRRLRASAPTASRSSRRRRTGSSSAAGPIPSSHVWREIRAAFNHFPKTDLFYADAADPRADHPAHRARGERRRDRGRGPHGRGLRGPLRGLLAPALLLPDRGGAAAGLRRRVRPGGLRHLGRLRRRDALHLLLRLETSSSTPSTSRRRAGSPSPSSPTGRTASAAALERAFGEREGRRALPPLRHAGVAQRPLPRGRRRRSRCPNDLRQHRGAREPARGPGVVPKTAERGLRPALLGARARPDRHPEDAAEPRPRRSPTSCASRSPCPRAAAASSTASRSRRRPTASPRCGGRAALRRRPARPRRGAGDRRPAERPHPLRRPHLARRRGAAHPAQPPAADPPPLERGHGQRRPRAQRAGGRGAPPLPSPPASTPASPATGRRAVAEADAGFARPRSRRCSSLAEDEVLRALDNLCAPPLRTNAYQRPERPVFSIKVDSRKVEGMPLARARCSRSTSTRAASRASTCAAAGSPAAASAGATGTTTSAPRSWAS